MNKQICRFSVPENSHQVNERPLHPVKVTIWCGLWANGVIGLFIFEKTISVNSGRYRDMTTDFLWSKLDRTVADDFSFQ